MVDNQQITSGVDMHESGPSGVSRPIRSRFWFRFVVAVMMTAAIVDFGGGFGIRYASTFLGLTYVIANYRDLTFSFSEFLVLFVIFILVPAWSVLNGLMHDGNISIARYQVTPFAAGIILFFLLSQGGSRFAIEVFLQVLTVLAAFSCFMIAYGIVFPGTFLIESFMDVMRTENDIHGKFGVRALGGQTFYGVYFKATLFYVAGFIYALYRGKWRGALLFLSALVLTVSKAGIALCAVFTMWYVLTVSSWKRRAALAALSIVIVALTTSLVDLEIVGSYLDYLSATFRGEATTSKVRIGHLKSFVDLMQEHPFYLIWGQGTGTQFVSLGEAARSGGVPHAVYNIELDHVDSIRQFGLPWFLGLTTLTAYVSLKLIWTQKSSAKKALGYAMGGLFIAAGTNPVLITPLFMMLLAAYYHYARGRI